MNHTLAVDHIQIVESLKNYKEAIKLASTPLLKSGYINDSYIEAMIKAIDTFGPYIVLQDEFAMPHALPEDGVNKTGTSLLVVKEGVDLLGHTIKVFLVLAPKTKDALSTMLTSLADFLMYKQNIINLYNAKSVESIQNLLEESW
jgi:mannitol/fructose-specific phosphotransferase system IIA component (Ntr-type)